MHSSSHSLILLALLVLLTACTTVRESSSSVDRHAVQDLMSRIDSMSRVRTVTHQDSAWHESVMRQFQSIRERSDTSHSVTLNASGDTIRERIIINNVRESTSETDRLEREVLMQRIESMDSTISLMRQQQSHTDSLLQQRDTVREKEVPARLSWWQQLRLWLGNIVLLGLAGCVVYGVLRLKRIV